MVVEQPTATPSKTQKATSASQEKILVTVRVRPLNGREKTTHDFIAWDFLDEHTIVLKNATQGRTPALYTFDKVFDPNCTSHDVYEAGARNVALSALSGINATVFAYGQTCSGKTYTMRGIHDLVIKDIYQHIKNSPERDFAIKFSAMEIYNETVIDLLNNEHGPLRLMDDPEKGTFVEKLSEEMVKDSSHLRNLISYCEDQRQVGETALNEKSSRSHQILRLVVESGLQDHLEQGKSLVASLNLVDLAGSERAGRTNAKGTKLKEGSYINRSLLTLTTVIRKLSGGRNAHVPYRDSKLTRILQFSLGGNARTAIICTMSPGMSQSEQSRKTLSFATNAKEVTNTAQVNTVVSDKRLVKHLQREVSRLEAELHKSPDVSSSSSRLKGLLAEKEQKIQQMEKEVGDLKRQRDCAQNQLEQERKVRKGGGRPGVMWPSGVPSTASMDASALMHEIRKLELRQRQLGDEASRALQALQLGNGGNAVENIAKLVKCVRASEEEEEGGGAAVRLLSRLDLEGISIASLEKKLDMVQRSIEDLILSVSSSGRDGEEQARHGRRVLHPRNCSDSLIWSPCSAEDALTPAASRRRPTSVSVHKVQKMFKNAAEENVRAVRSYVTELKERVAKLQYQKQLLVCQVLELEESDPAHGADGREAETRRIVMLWHLCHVSIVHRTHFYLLFRGMSDDDRIYMQVELRRLAWLQQQLADSPASTPPAASPSAAGALKQEREQLARRVTSRLSLDEREALYAKWDVPPVGRHRRLQLINRLWSDPTDMLHVQESAEVVARLVGFCDGDREMFQLNFVSPSPSDKTTPWMPWNLISNLLHFS